MTVSSTINTAGPFSCNGVIVDFPFTFPVFAVSDLRVYLVDPTLETNTLLAYGTDYTVTLATLGGTVSTVATYAAGKQILLKRVLPETQEIDLVNQGDWLPESHEEAFDRAVMLIQQLQEEADRSLQLDESGFSFDADSHRIINLSTGVDSTDAVTLAQMQAGDTASYSAAVAAAFAAMVAWVTSYVTAYWPISTPVSNPSMVTPSTQTVAAGTTRIYFPVPVHGIILSLNGSAQAQTKDFTFVAGNNYIDLVDPLLVSTTVTAFIYTSSSGVTTFDHDYTTVLAGATSAVMPGGAFTSGIVCCDGSIQTPIANYVHVSGSDTINFTSPFLVDTTVLVIKL